MQRTRMLSNWVMMAALAIAPIAASAQPVQLQPTRAEGNWVNPKGSVKVSISDCSGNLCGWVTWANPEAHADADAAGVKQLVGTKLLRDYKTTGQGRWQGQVYVPDMGRTFYSTITQLDPQRLKISGCVLGGLICKSQVWQRA